MNEAFYALAEVEYRDLKDGGRGNYLGFPECELLEHACGFLNESLCATCYLVGSATQTKQYRDVDVRMIMHDEEYDRLFGTSGLSPLWSVINTSVSYWLRHVTGLPVDFQIQRMTHANKAYSKQTRNALGLKTRVHLEGDQLPEFLREITTPDC